MNPLRTALLQGSGQCASRNNVQMRLPGTYLFVMVDIRLILRDVGGVHSTVEDEQPFLPVLAFPLVQAGQ
jgi:hypothetical protein